MKNLYLLRHAKSDWGTRDRSTVGRSTLDREDHDRPLAPRGVEAATRMGRVLAALGEAPDRVLGSTALRARDTAERAKAAGGWSCPIELSRRLYLTSPSVVLEEIQGTEAAVRRLLVVGHQPVWGELASELIGGGRLGFPTAALARIDFEVERWSDLRPGEGTLKWLLIPKAIPFDLPEDRR